MSCGWDGVVVVAGFVDVVVFLAEGVAPVLVEVAVGFHGAWLRDCFGAGESPAGSGEVHPVFNQMAAGGLDVPGRDRPAVDQRGG